MSFPLSEVFLNVLPLGPQGSTIPHVPGRLFAWQALFGLHVQIQPFEKRRAFKWGFNEAVLYDEAADRQKLFIESLHPFQFFERNERDCRSLAIVARAIPTKGIQVALIGRVLGETREHAVHTSQEYLQQVLAACPYDFQLAPAASEEEYQQLCCADLLAQDNLQMRLLQVRRQEVLLNLPGSAAILNGNWSSSPHADEQIWRALSHCNSPAFVQILLTPAMVFDEERQAMLDLKQAWKLVPTNGQVGISGLEKLVDQYVERYSRFAQKYYHLQVHLLTALNADGHLSAAAGSAITRPDAKTILSGYSLLESGQDAQSWAWRSAHLEFNRPLRTPGGLERLRDLVDLNEAVSVFRLPYPPAATIPDLNFV